MPHQDAAQDVEALTWRLLLAQVGLGIVANLAGVSAGANFGFTAIALPEMRAANATVHVTEEEASWIAGVSALATPVGCLLSGWLLDRLGRRAALLWQNAPALLGWTLLAVPLPLPGGGGLPQVFVGRILTGLATGMGSIPGTVYSAEVSVKRLRGLLVTWTSISISFGIVTVYAVGAVLSSWRLVAATCACVPVLSGVLVFLFAAESPVWLAGRGRAAEAQAALVRLRRARHPDLVREELDALLRDQRQPARGRNLRGVLHDLRRPECWKPLVIMNLFFLFQQLSGVFVVVFYAVDVVVEAGVASDPYLVTVLIGLARLLVTLLTGVLSNRLGRRALALASGGGMTACMLLLAWHLTQPLAGQGPWVSAATLVGFILMSSLGFLTLPWSMIGEVFPARFRGAAGGFTTCSAYVYSFVLLKLYPSMVHQLSRRGLFLFYGVMSLLGTVFVAVCLPETQGRTLQEVEDYFRGREAQVHAAEMKALNGKEKDVIASVE